MPNPTNNKLVDSKTIAALFDMTPRRVQQLTKDGVIAAVKEGNANRYDLLPTIQRYIRYLTAKANGREPSKKDSEIEGRRLEAEADLKRSKADIAALQLSELEGTMHRSEDVEAVMTDLVYNSLGRALRAAFLGLCRRPRRSKISADPHKLHDVGAADALEVADVDVAVDGDDRHHGEIYKTIITELEKGAGEPLYPGDERRIFGEALVPVFVALYNSLNDVGRQTLLRYARGEVLDAIGERQDVKRLEGTPAKTTMRFSVSTPQERNIIIPKWTKVTPDSENYFATDEIAVLQAGAYSVEVPTSAVSNGTKFNGYAAGTIATLVDLIPYIESVTNLTETAGGDDGEPYTTEGDNRLRERIRLAPAKRSTAGPEQAYIYWVMTADSSIVDAKAVSEKETVSETLTVYDGKAFKGGGALLTDSLVVKAHGQSTAAAKDTDYTVDYTDGLLTITLKGSLSAAESIDIIITRTLEGCVKIVPLLEGGGIPDAAMLAKVLDVVNAKDIRPLTDKVSAVPPEVETYDIEIVYYTTPKSEAEVIANVEGTGGAIDRYNEWQVAALGRDINPDQLRKRILSPSWGENLTGAFRVDVVKPTYKALDDTQVAKFSGHLTVSHKVESEVV